MTIRNTWCVKYFWKMRTFENEYTTVCVHGISIHLWVHRFPAYIWISHPPLLHSDFTQNRQYFMSLWSSLYHLTNTIKNVIWVPIIISTHVYMHTHTHTLIRWSRVFSVSIKFQVTASQHAGGHPDVWTQLCTQATSIFIRWQAPSRSSPCVLGPHGRVWGPYLTFIMFSWNIIFNKLVTSYFEAVVLFRLDLHPVFIHHMIN